MNCTHRCARVSIHAVTKNGSRVKFTLYDISPPLESENLRGYVVNASVILYWGMSALKCNKINCSIRACGRTNEKLKTPFQERNQLKFEWLFRGPDSGWPIPHKINSADINHNPLLSFLVILILLERLTSSVVWSGVLSHLVPSDSRFKKEIFLRFRSPDRVLSSCLSKNYADGCLKLVGCSTCNRSICTTLLGTMRAELPWGVLVNVRAYNALRMLTAILVLLLRSVATNVP